MKIVITADLHLANDHKIGGTNPKTGLTYRFEDYLRNLDTICQHVIEEADMLVIAGDIFHSRKPSETVRRDFAKCIRKVLDAKKKVLILIGNHDLYYQQGLAHTLAVFQALEVPNLIIVDKPSIVEIEDISFLCMPFYSAAKLKLKPKELNELWNKDLNRIKKEAKGKKILVAHQTCEGGVGGDERVSLSRYDDHSIVPEISEDEIDIAFFGHLHRAQEYKVNNIKVLYPGSIESISMGESLYKKRFVEYDSNTKKINECNLFHRKYYNLKFNFIHKELTSEDVVNKINSIDNLEEAVLKVSITLTSEQSRWLDRRKIKEASNKAWWAYELSETKSDSSTKEDATNITEQLNMEQAIEMYVENTIRDKAKKKMLMRVASKIIQEVEEEYEEY